MAHAGQLDDLAPSDPEEQVPELSNQQEVNMMKGLIHNMMKQHLKDIMETPSWTKEVKGQHGDSQV
eukprot:166424-Prorocentrum_lima.AAC.1